MNSLTVCNGLMGGALIGCAASLLLLGNGRIAGVSGIVGGVLAPVRRDVLWRVLFLVGLLAAGVAGALLAPSLLSASPRSLPLLAMAGLLVGVGTRIGNGCTSGHGVCGISRLSTRSIVATLTFIATGVLTVALQRLVAGR
jgi:uncharacterized membrane protein YedE/YeeE